MHGGGCTPEWYLGGEDQQSKLKNMLDQMIRDGLIEPLIVCAVSYLNEYCGDAVNNCLNFRFELTNDLMPVFEKKFKTYAVDIMLQSFADSRRHRAFSGYSMGAVVTWNIFGYCLDRFAYFIPMSGDCWALGATAGGTRPYDTAAELEYQVIESGMTPDDFYIYTGCGDKDIAEPNLTPQINAMKESEEIFKYCDNFSEGNLYQCVCPGCGHDLNRLCEKISVNSKTVIKTLCLEWHEKSAAPVFYSIQRIL